MRTVVLVSAQAGGESRMGTFAASLWPPTSLLLSIIPQGQRRWRGAGDFPMTFRGEAELSLDELRSMTEEREEEKKEKETKPAETKAEVPAKTPEADAGTGSAGAEDGKSPAAGAGQQPRSRRRGKRWEPTDGTGDAAGTGDEAGGDGAENAGKQRRI